MNLVILPQVQHETVDDPRLIIDAQNLRQFFMIDHVCNSPIAAEARRCASFQSNGAFKGSR